MFVSRYAIGDHRVSSHVRCGTPDNRNRRILAKNSVYLSISLFLIYFAIGSIPSLSQGRVQGDFDRDIPIPKSIHTSEVRRDASGVAELTAYKSAIGGAAWVGMQASGMLSFAGSNESLPATLAMLPGNRGRFDVTRANGHDLTVLNGNHASVTYAGSQKKIIAPTSAVAGVVPFDLPLEAISSGATHSIVDQGDASLDGHTLHRVSVGVPLPPRHLRLPDDPVQTTVDLYFDTETHLLYKAATLIAIPGTSTPVLLRVTTFEDYKPFGAGQIPTTLTETVNGQQMWVLTLSDIDLKNLPSRSAFAF